jgi:hypothetical protein
MDGNGGPGRPPFRPNHGAIVHFSTSWPPQALQKKRCAAASQGLDFRLPRPFGPRQGGAKPRVVGAGGCFLPCAAGLFDSDEETTRIFLQQPGASATVRTMQPTFPPAPEFRPPNMVADPASAVRALDRVSWDDPITPANLTTMREVPSELQGDLLEAMRDILRI